ncbi:MAG: Fe-S protein assembly chaperone HscA [Gemmataceae bacterium]
MNDEIVGIDLGTTFSLAAYSRNGKTEVVRDSKGNCLIPSIISIHRDGNVFVGSEAKSRSLSDPTDTIFSIKRLIGRNLKDLERDLPYIPYQIKETVREDGRIILTVKIGDKDFTPEEVSAIILGEVKRLAGNPQKAVITVPAYFDDAQRQATRDAGKIAGLDVLRIINEPTAAALAYGLDRKRSGTIVVYDLGGGTFDCSVLSISDGVFKVLSTNGDTHLGGDDFDHAIMELIINDKLQSKSKLTPVSIAALKMEADKTKRILSSDQTAQFNLKELPFIGEKLIEITREEFEVKVAPLVERTIQCCKRALKDAGVKSTSVDEIVMVGGSSRIPLVRKMVQEFFNKKPLTSINPDEAIAIGAAVQGEILSGKRKNLLLLDVIPLSLGIETLGGAISKLIHRNTTIPAIATERFSTGVDNQTGIVFNIYQGERELAKDCKNLGKFILSGFPPMPAQMPQVDVSFIVDANGILTVSAREIRSGVEASVKVQPASGLSKDEIENIVLESIEHADEDFKQRMLIELRNKAGIDLNHARRIISNKDLKIKHEDMELIVNSMASLENSLKQNDPGTIKNILDKFQTILTPFASMAMDAAAKTYLANQKPEQLNDLGI